MSRMVQAAAWFINLNDTRSSLQVSLLVLCGSGLLLAVGVLLVHLTGGTPNVHAHFMYLPVFLAAAVYGVWGGLLAGLFAGLLLGPVLGGDLDNMQTVMNNWGVRTLWFMVIGAASGFLVQMIQALGRERRKQALTDPTTGLPNQVALMETLEARLTQNKLEKKYITVCLLRATDFSDIVEVFGVEEGDRIILEASQRLCRACPEIRFSCRFGTSELALIVETERDEDLKTVAREMHKVAAASFSIDGVPVRIEPALGVGHGGDLKSIYPPEIVRRARVALTRAVSQEQEWVSYEPTFDTATAATLELVARAEQALHAGEFELHYQPKIRLADCQPVGAEALARWRRPNEGIVSPGAFMPKLERTSLIDTFSRYVIHTAVDYAKSGALLPVSINLAPRNLTDDSLVDVLIDSLHEAGLPPENLEVEVTESGLMQDPKATIRLLRRLREHGIAISIDDFGTGYSSFAYLRTLPVTGLKIDQTFVQHVEEDARTRRLVLAMIEAGHALDLTVTAEGIETKAQARILTELGCDFGQGFLWSPALEASKLDEWRSEGWRVPE